MPYRLELMYHRLAILFAREQVAMPLHRAELKGSFWHMADPGGPAFESRQAGRAVSPVHPEIVSETAPNQTNETHSSYEISLASYERCLTWSPDRICEPPPNETRMKQEWDFLSQLPLQQKLQSKTVSVPYLALQILQSIQIRIRRKRDYSATNLLQSSYALLHFSRS